MNPILKRVLLATLTARPLARMWAPFMRGRGTIFMFHRFTDPSLGIMGHEPGLLRAALAYLRSRGIAPGSAVAQPWLIGYAPPGWTLRRPTRIAGRGVVAGENGVSSF